MIWMCLIVMTVLVLAVGLAPLYRRAAPEVAPSEEIANYLAQIEAIDRQLASDEANASALTAKKTDLERRLLEGARAQEVVVSRPPALMLSVLIGGFSFAAWSLYAALGRPELSTEAGFQNPALPAAAQAQSANETPLSDLVEQLAAKLAEDGSNPNGWILYGRSLMTLERYDEAFTAYEKALRLNEDAPNVAAELARARAFAAQKQSGSMPGPSADDVAAAEAMSEAERASMIEGMVEGLSERLKDNPENPEGWVRLLRARKVLGQTQTAQTEIIRMRAAYVDRPEKVEAILSKSGWAEE